MEFNALPVYIYSDLDETTVATRAPYWRAIDLKAIASELENLELDHHKC